MESTETETESTETSTEQTTEMSEETDEGSSTETEASTQTSKKLQVKKLHQNPAAKRLSHRQILKKYRKPMKMLTNKVNRKKRQKKRQKFSSWRIMQERMRKHETVVLFLVYSCLHWRLICFLTR
ncbi:MAG: hypothetical protein ACLTFZ_03350 [Lachnospiraceae bacterium]